MKILYIKSLKLDSHKIGIPLRFLCKFSAPLHRKKRAPGNGWFPGALLIQFSCTAAAAVHSAFYKMPCCRSNILQFVAAGGLEVGKNKAIQIAVHHSLHIAAFIAGAMIFHQRVGHKHIAADLMTPGDLILHALDIVDLFELFTLFDLKEL